MKLNGDKVTVDMKVQNNVALGKDSRAVIMVTTILGSRYVSLHPGGGGPLENNTIDINHTEVPYDLQEALQDIAVNYGEVNTDQLAAAVEALPSRHWAGRSGTCPRWCPRRWITSRGSRR